MVWVEHPTTPYSLLQIQLWYERENLVQFFLSCFYILLQIKCSDEMLKLLHRLSLLQIREFLFKIEFICELIFEKYLDSSISTIYLSNCILWFVNELWLTVMLLDLIYWKCCVLSLNSVQNIKAKENNLKIDIDITRHGQALSKCRHQYQKTSVIQQILNTPVFHCVVVTIWERQNQSQALLSRCKIVCETFVVFCQTLCLVSKRPLEGGKSKKRYSFSGQWRSNDCSHFHNTLIPGNLMRPNVCHFTSVWRGKSNTFTVNLIAWTQWAA